MFNKYRGQTQNNNQNRPLDHHERIRETQPKPVVAEKEKTEMKKETFVPSSVEEKPTPEVKVRYEVDNELLRQQEEDEWFRRFKGESEPAVKEEPVPEKPLFEEDLALEKELQSKDESGEPFAEDRMEEAVWPEENENPNEPEPLVLEEPETTDGEESVESVPETIPEEHAQEIIPEEPEPMDSPESTETHEADFSEELSALEAELTETENENKVAAPSSILEETIPVKMFEDLEREEEKVEEEPALTPEEDDEKWIQDLLTDIQEKTGTSPEEEEEPAFAPAAKVTVFDVPDNEISDESSWYQSTPLIRTAALIVLDLTEDLEEEQYVEETDEEQESYLSDDVVEEEELPVEPDGDAVLTSIDEAFDEMPEVEVEEVTIDDVDEKLANLMEKEPKEDLDMDAMLDNMDRIIQQTEATPVRFVEETTPAPAPRPRPTPNRNRKKKKKKKR